MFFETIRDKERYFHKGDNLCPLHFHRSAEVLYVLSGKKTAILNGKQYALGTGDVIFFPPYGAHILPFLEGGEQLVVTVSAEHCPKFETFCKNNTPVSPVVKDTDGTFLKLMTALESPKNEVLLTGLANCLFGLYMEKGEFIPAKEEREKPPVQEIAEYIDAHYAEPLSLSSLAERFGYSPNYFSALFKRLFQMGVSQYVNFVRVQKSVKLLQMQKISAVYFSVGFQSPQQYFLNFKKFYGCSPKEYLKK